MLVKAAHKLVARVLHGMLEYARELAVKVIFRHAVVVVKTRLRRPAEVKRRGDVYPAPFKYRRQLAPVVNVFVLQLLNGCACDYQSVEIFVLYLIELFIRRGIKCCFRKTTITIITWEQVVLNCEFTECSIIYEKKQARQ